MILLLGHKLNFVGLPNRVIYVRSISTFGASIRCPIERLSTRQVLDFDLAVRAFSNARLQPFRPTAEMGLVLYAMDLLAPTAIFPPGDCPSSLHGSRMMDRAIGLLLATL